MNKYKKLWEYIADKKEEMFTMDFSEIEKVLSFPIDHSFLNEKKELLTYGYQVLKISLKDKKVYFKKINK